MDEHLKTAGRAVVLVDWDEHQPGYPRLCLADVRTIDHVVVRQEDGYRTTLARALEHTNGKNSLALVALRHDVNLIAPTVTLKAMRKAAQAARPATPDHLVF
jgi:hypothetical protein